MKKAFRLALSLLMALCLTLSCLMLLTAWMTTAQFADLSLGGRAEMAQQARINAEARALSEAWHMTGPALDDAAAGAARTHRQTLAAWWNGLFNGESDAALPLFLTEEAERALIADVMADEGFAAHVEPDMLRAVARDDVAYALDEAVCRAVLPLRRSLTDLALAVADMSLPLSMLRPALLTAAGVLLTAAVICGLLLKRGCSAALFAAALWMAILSVPVWLLDIPGMLAQLNQEAAVVGEQLLQALALPWYGAAGLLALVGCMVARKGR